MTEGSEEWFWCKLAIETGLPFQFCQESHTVDDFFRWIRYFELEKEREQRRETSHEKVDHLAARICLEIDRLAHRLLRLKGQLPNNIARYYVEYTLGEHAKGNGTPPKPQTPEDIVTQTVRNKAIMFAALGIKQQAKWEGALPNGD